MSRNGYLGRVVLGVVCLGIGYGATVVAQSPSGGGGSGRRVKVGVVDIGVLFKEYDRKDDLEERINGEREEMKAGIEADQEQIEKMRRGLDSSGLVRGSARWQARADEIKIAQRRLELKQRRLQEALKKRVEEFTLQVLTELEKTIQHYGTRHGYTVIFKVDDGKPLDGAAGELGQQFQERIFRAQISDVVFHEDTIDCTRNVLGLLNSPSNRRRMRELAKEEKEKENK